MSFLRFDIRYFNVVFLADSLLDRFAGDVDISHREDIREVFLGELSCDRLVLEICKRDDTQQSAVQLPDIEFDFFSEQVDDFHDIVIDEDAFFFCLFRRIATRVSKSGGWISAIMLDLILEVRRSSSSFSLFG